MTMKFVYRTAVRTFLCTGLLLGSGALALAQEPAGKQPAPDNTKVNERDRSKDEPTADQQKNNRSDPHHSADTTIHHEIQITFHVCAQRQNHHSEWSGHAKGTSAIGRREKDGRDKGHRSGGRKQGNQPIGRQTQELTAEAKGESKWQAKTQQYLAFIRIERAPRTPSTH